MPEAFNKETSFESDKGLSPSLSIKFFILFLTTFEEISSPPSIPTIAFEKKNFN